MATRELRLHRGRRRGRETVRRLIEELVSARRIGSVSQQTLARDMGRSQSDISRLERLLEIDRVSFVEMSELASLLGLELSAGLHPVGEPIRDQGHQALIGRFRALLSPAYKVMAEVPLPAPGDRRSWDLLLRLPGYLIGVEAETRIRDMQRLVRQVHQRERDGGVNQIVVLLAATRTNRELLHEFKIALGPTYATSSRLILKSLRLGEPLPGSGVVLL